MLDHLLEVSYRADTEAKEKRAFVEALRKLPLEDLSKLASGETTLAKLAMDCGPSSGGTASWLEKYKGTPLFDQALVLEQSELQSQMARQQNEMQQQDGQQFWRENDKICLQKRMLDLQLVQSEQQAMTGAPPPPSPEAPAQGAGAPGAGAPNNEEMMGASSEQGVKVSSAGLWKKLGGVIVPIHDKKKEKTSAVKEAINFGAMGSALKGNLGSVAKAMPQGALMHAGIGAGIGAVGGAVAGGPDHRLSGALGGAAVGGGAGLAGSNIARAAKAGGGLTGQTAMKGLEETGRQMKLTGAVVADGVKEGLRPTVAKAKAAPSGIPVPGSSGTQAGQVVPRTPSVSAIPLLNQ